MKKQKEKAIRRTIMHVVGMMISATFFIWVLLASLFLIAQSVETDFFGFVILGGILAIFISAVSYHMCCEGEVHEDFIKHNKMMDRYETYKKNYWRGTE